MLGEIGGISALPHSSAIRPFGLLGRGSLPVESLCRVARCFFVHATSSRTNEWMWSGGFGIDRRPENQPYRSSDFIASETFLRILELVPTAKTSSASSSGVDRPNWHKASAVSKTGWWRPWSVISDGQLLHRSVVGKR